MPTHSLGFPGNRRGEQLLEEMMDNGYPLTTEPNALKAMIMPPTVTLRRLLSPLPARECPQACERAAPFWLLASRAHRGLPLA